MPGQAAALAAALTALLVATSLRADDAPKVAAPSADVATPADNINPAAVVQWDQAEQHVGEDATVEGRVLGVHCSPLSCLLAFDPSFSRFRAVIEASSFTKFPPERLAERFSGRRVHVHGKITQSGGRPEIVVDSPDDLTVMVAERRREQEERAALTQQANTQLMERIAATLERLEALTEQLVAAQDRLEAQMSALDQRTAAVAANTAPAPENPGPPPRAGFERMRTVKRGMSRADVIRLMGEPSSVQPGNGGWTTWYWDTGESVAFDGRGRAQSVSGFFSH